MFEDKIFVWFLDDKDLIDSILVLYTVFGLTIQLHTSTVHGQTQVSRKHSFEIIVFKSLQNGHFQLSALLIPTTALLFHLGA